MQRNAAGENRERLREAIGALREYQPLAVQMLELAVLLERLAEIALDDVKAINEVEAGLSTGEAIDHLEAVVGELTERNMHLGAAVGHVEKALHDLQPSRPHGLH